ncbi:MAG: sterol desaturase family protein [Nannocystaceae bacterium]|jgi:sterol desaturase/sphingolipid hydroxylase (fatty acid hydroxylase superfamily)
MDIIPPYLFPLVFFVALAIDRVVAARPQPVVRHWALKGTIFFLLTAFIRTAIPAAIAGALAGHTLFDLSGLGMIGGAVAVVLLVTFADYWLHRTAHRWDWLWRWAHQMHHSAERVDLAGFSYGHPFDNVLAAVVGALAVAVLGVTPEAAAVAGFFGFLTALFDHINIRTPRWVGYLVQRPEAHTLHHHRGVHAYNYGLPLWDMLFGTFRNPVRVEGPAGFWDGASTRVLPMLLGRDVSMPPGSLPQPRRVR